MDQKTQSNLTALSNYQNSSNMMSTYQQSTVIQSEQHLDLNYSYEDLQLQIQQLQHLQQQQNNYSQTIVEKEGLNIRVEGETITVVSERKEQYGKGKVAQLLAQNKQLKIQLELVNNKLIMYEHELNSKTAAKEQNIEDPAEQIRVLTFELQSKNIEIQELNQNIRTKDQELVQLKEQLEHLEDMVQKLHKKKSEKIIKEIPVYIEKDVVVQVPVPIYINQKEQKINTRLMPLLGSSQEQNSIAANDIYQSMEIDEKDDSQGQPIDLKNKLGPMCRSIVGSNVDSNFSEQFASNPKIGSLQQNTRNPRIKQIVEVPVYIVKQIQKIVEKPIIQEVIKYVEVDRNSRELKHFSSNDEQGAISCITPRKDSHHSEEHQQTHMQLLLQSNEKTTPPESNIEEQQNSDSNHPKESYLKIEEEPELREQSRQSSIKAGQDSDLSNNKEKEQILVEIPVEIEKMILVPVEVPVEIYIEIERIKEVPVIEERIVVKQIEVEKPVYIEVLKTQVLPVDVPYEIYVDREVEKMVESIVPFEVPVEIMLASAQENILSLPIVEIPTEIFIQNGHNTNERAHLPVIEIPTEIVIERIIHAGPVIKEVVRQIEIIKEVPVEREVVIEKQKIVEIVKEIPIEIPIEVERFVNVEVPVETIKIQYKQVDKIIQKEVIREVEVETILPIQFPVEIIIEKEKTTIVEVPQPQVMEIQQIDSDIQDIPEPEIIYVEVPTQIHLPSQFLPQIVERVIQIERMVEVEKPIFVEKTIEKYIEIPVQKIVEVEKIVYVDRMAEIIEVPVDKIVYVDREVPVQKMAQIIEVEVSVEKIIQVEIPVQIIVQKIIHVEVPVQILVERIIQRPVIIYQEVPVEIIKQVIVEVQREVVKEVIIEKPVEVIKEVIKEVITEVIVEKPVDIIHEIVKEIQVERIVEVEKEVVREVEVQKIVQVEKEVIKEVIVERPIQVEKQIYIEVPVEIIRQVVKQIIVEKPIEIEKEVIREIQVERIVEVEKEVLKEIIVERPVETVVEVERQVIKEISVDKPVYLEKEVIKGVYVQIPIEIIREIEKEVIREVIVEKPIEIIKQIEKEVIRQVVVEKPVEIIKEIYIEKEICIERESDRQGFPQTPPAQIERLELRQDSHKSNEGVLLSDSSQGDRQQEQAFPFPPTQNFQIAEGGWQEERQSLIQRYSEQQRKLQEQLEFMRDELSKVTKKIEYLQEENIKLEEDLQQNLIESQQLRKKSKNSRVLQMELQQLRQNVQRQSKNRQRQQKAQSLKIKDLTQTVTTLKNQLKQQKASHQSVLQKLHTFERSKEHELSQLYRQLQQKHEQLEDLAISQQQIMEHNNQLKQQCEKILNDRNNLEEEYNQLKNILEDRQQDQESARKDEIEYRIREEISKTEKIYQHQIEELIHKNYNTINQKNQQIAQLSNIIKELQNQIGKANDYIQNMPQEQHQRTDKNVNSKVSVRSEMQLKEQNKKLAVAVQNLKQQLQEVKQRNQVQIKGQPKRFEIVTRSGKNTLTINERQGQKNQKSHIKIEQIGKNFQFESEQDIYLRMNKLVNDYARELEKKDKELDKMKELLCMYEAVIEDLQRQRGHPYQARNYQGTTEGFYRPVASDNKLNLDTNVYVSNLLRKITLLEEQLKFQKSEKLRAAMRVRQLQRAFEQINVRQATQSIEDDSELIQKLVYQLQHEKDNCQQYRLENQALSEDLYKLKNQLQMLKNNSYIPKSQQYSMLADLDQQFEKEFYGQKEQTIIRHYKTYKIKYIKVLELTQLIKKEVTGLQLRASKNCAEIIDNIKRYIKIIENNEKNSTSITGNKESRMSREMQRKQREDDDLLKDMRKIDSTLNQEEQTSNLQKKQRKEIRFSDLTFDNLIVKNPPREVKYIVSFKLIEFGLELLQQRQIDNLWPQKIFVMHFSPSNTDSLRLTLAKNQKSKDKVRLYQAPEVLVGQPESAKSYSWSIGIIIDKLFHGRLFYQKFGDILDHKDNYEFEDRQYRDIGEIVEQMVTKNRDHRLALEIAYEEVGALLR